jgi:hypothetical protein
MFRDTENCDKSDLHSFAVAEAEVQLLLSFTGLERVRYAQGSHLLYYPTRQSAFYRHIPIFQIAYQVSHLAKLFQHYRYKKA